MGKQFLFIVTSHGELGTTGNRGGSWLEELAAPYWRFVDAGYAVTIASPAGGAAPIDPASREDSWLSDAGRRFLADEAAAAALDDTQRIDAVEIDAFAGVFMVGGAAATWDFPHNATLRHIVERYFAEERVVAGVCHGVIGMIGAIDQHGEPLVKNRRLTAISNAEDVMMGLDRVVPVLPEEMLRKLRAVYTAAAPLAQHVVVDPPFFTGQNPASADPLAVHIVAHLERADTRRLATA